MVAGAAEVYLRKPRVGDFSRLRENVMHLRGWWRNRIARVLLVFALSTLGSTIGTYLAGFQSLVDWPAASEFAGYAYTGESRGG